MEPNGQVILELPESVERALREYAVSHNLTMRDLVAAALVLLFLRAVAGDEEVRDVLRRVLEGAA